MPAVVSLSSHGWLAGFHLCRSQLDAMPNAAEAHARRGAHWTFDAARFVQSVRQLRTQRALAAGLPCCLRLLLLSWQRSAASLSLPSFDHAVGDPVEDDILVKPEHRVVIIEGLYTLLGEPGRCTLRQQVVCARV